MYVYALDVDETLEISGGPITLQSIMDLRSAGHIVGICGNWGLVTSTLQGWQHMFSFLNVGVPKPEFLTELKKWTKADDYVMVGNIGPECSQLYGKEQTGCSNDLSAATKAGWRFILESDFAGGQR